MNNSAQIKNNQYQCIIESPGISKRIRRMFYRQKMSPRDILNTLKAEGVTVRGKPLIDLAHITNRLPPTTTRWKRYRLKQSKLKSVFLEAYEKGSNPKEQYIYKLTSVDIECILEAVNSHKLPSELLMKPKSLHKWFKFHRDHEYFVKAKRAALAEFSEAAEPADETADDGAQADLFDHARLSAESLQRVEALEKRLSDIEYVLADIAELITKRQSDEP